MDIPIIGKQDLGPYPINMFYSQNADEDSNLPGLVGTPGLKDYYDPSYAYPVRGLQVMGDYLYDVIGNRVYQITTTPSGTQLTGTLSGIENPVFMIQDGTYLMIVEPGVAGYTWTTGGNVTAISDTDFPTPQGLAWQDGYFIVSEHGTGIFYISDSANPTSWPGDFTTAEASPDSILNLLSDHREVLCFGSQTIQPYYDSGNATFPFEAIMGAVLQEGLGAAHSVAAGDNTVFFLDVHGRIMRISGHAAQPISSRAIEKEITGYSIFSDAIGYYYAHQGHGFYILTFPTGDATWVFDVSVQAWHKRRSYPVHPDGTEGRWRGNCHAFFDNKHIIGDWQNGKLYELDFDTYTDNSQTIRRYFDFPAIGDGQTRIRHNKLKLDYKAGVGITGSTPTVGVDPQTMLQWSDDGGKTWSNELTRSMGKIGEYYTEVNFRRLGTSKRRIYRNIVSDPVEVVITGAHLN